MSLVIHLGINDTPIEMIAVRRIAGDDHPDSRNIYEVRRFDTIDGAVRQIVDAVTVVHRYGDGAAVLAREALAAVTA
jgi:hypothetical protein